MGFSSSNGQQSHDQLGLLWIPLSASIKTVYHISGINFVRPFLRLGAGAQWFRQTASQPRFQAINDSFWVPYYVISPGFAFLEGSGLDWFGGFNFSFSYASSLASSQNVKGLGFGLSLNILF